MNKKSNLQQFKINILLRIFLILFYSQFPKLNAINGLAIKSNIIYILKPKQLELVNINDSKKTKTIELSNSIVLLDLLSTKICSLNNINDDSLKSTINKSVKAFSAINITVHQNQIFVCIKFRIEHGTIKGIKYALLEYSPELKPVNFYYFKTEYETKYFTIPPFNSFDFTSRKTFLLTILKDPNFNLFSFYMDSLKQVVYPIKTISSNLFIGEKKSINSSDRIILDPLINTVNDANFSYYFQYPFPIIKSTNGEVFDPFNTQKFMDSCEAEKDFKMFGNFTNGLSYKYTINKFNYVILSTKKIDSSIYMVVANKIKDRIELVTYNVYTKKHNTKTLSNNLSNYYYIFSNEALYSIEEKNETYVINKLSL